VALPAVKAGVGALRTTQVLEKVYSYVAASQGRVRIFVTGIKSTYDEQAAGTAKFKKEVTEKRS
jgi:ribosomal protein L20A (L18A)